MATPTTFGDFIRGERLRAELGLRESARMLQMSASYLSRVEAGDFPPPSAVILNKMANLYGTDMKRLFDEAKGRQHELMAADAGVAPAIHEFYRLAYSQPPDVQEKMLTGAVRALDLPEAQKEKLIAELRDALARAGEGDLPRLAKGRLGLFASDVAPRFLSRVGIRARAASVLRQVFGSEIPIPVPLETVINNVDRDIRLIVHDEIEGVRLRDGSPSVLGLSRWSKDGRRRELVIHEDLFEATDHAARRRANFTMAHELFHCIEHLPLVQRKHPDVVMARRVAFVSLAPQLAKHFWYEKASRPRRLTTNEDWREWQANQFAAELLMPVSSVTAAFEELFGVSSQIAQGCGSAEFADRTARSVAADDLGGVTTLVDRFDVNPQAMAIRLLDLGLIVAGDHG